MKRLLIITCLWCSISLNQVAQSFERNYDIPVIVDGNSLENPWAGGLNSCQVSRIDVNLDGAKDIFIFDRIGSRISVYLNMNNTPGVIDYKYTLDYNHLFPQGMRNWVLLRDMNCDGKEDICTNAGSGFKIFWNNSETALSFNPNGGNIIQAYYDFGGDAFHSGVYCIAPDLPAFNDYDGDGDIDIWSWNEYSTSEYFYKNMSVENGTCETPDFVCRNRCYGKFGESSESFQIFIGEEFNCDFNVVNPRSAEAPPMRHTGGTTLAIDLDQDGLRDLVIGDVTENTLAALMVDESSSQEDSVTIVHYDFPATFNNTLAAVMTTFLGAFYEDIDNDGIHDLLISPNTFNDAADRRSLFLYLNTGQNDLPNFELVQDDFLQHGMIDVGVNAYPVIFDLNQDGLKDLFVVNRKSFDLGITNTTRIWYYRNTGTMTDPEFTLTDENWLNIPSHAWQSVYPTFGDLDGDGDADLMVGDQEGQLHYFENTAGANQPAVFVLTTNSVLDNFGQILDVGQNATPQIVDLNEDGKSDLIIGELNGCVNYYENIGTINDYSFTLIEDSIGNVAATSILGIQGKSVPFMHKNTQDNWELLIGTETGQINQFDQIEGNILGDFHLVTLSYENIFEGERCAPFLADITGDDQDDLFLGNIGGGVGVYTHLPISVGVQYYSGKIKVFPNPANDYVWFEMPEELSYPVRLSIFDNTGRMVQSSQILNNKYRVSTATLPDGFYVFQISSEEFVANVKLVIRK